MTKLSLLSTSAGKGKKGAELASVLLDMKCTPERANWSRTSSYESQDWTRRSTEFARCNHPSKHRAIIHHHVESY